MIKIDMGGILHNINDSGIHQKVEHNFCAYSINRISYHFS